MKKKLILIALSLFVTAGVLAGCNNDQTPSPTPSEPVVTGDEQPGSTEPSDSNTPATPKPTPAPTPTRPPITSFVDQKLEGFDVTVSLPEIWQGKTVLTKLPPEENQNAIGDFEVTFAPPDLQLSQSGCLGWISVYKSDVWNSFTDEQKGDIIKLAEIDGNVYVFFAIPFNPYEYGTEEANLYNSLFITPEEVSEFLKIKKAS